MSKTQLIVDGHAHIYDCYDLDTFFDSAINNLNHISSFLCPDDKNFQKIILLTEGKKNNYFRQFKINSSLNKQIKYRFKNTKESNSLAIMKDNKFVSYLLAGRQIVTREGLEVLLIASNQTVEDGLPIEEVVKNLIEQKEIVVLAWGVGKWFFKRGNIIKNIIKKYSSPYLFIGDSSNRPQFWSTPKLYNFAKNYGLGILKGSDPFPFGEEVNRIGSSGFSIEGNFQQDKPARSFKNILASNKKNIEFFAYQDDTLLFLRRQSKMFLRKYVARL